MDINELTIGQAKELSNIFGGGASDKKHPYVIDKNCMIRTVTHIYTGKLVAVYDQELVIEDAAWIADTGRFADSLKDFDNLSEVEPFPHGQVVIGRGAICDYHSTDNSVPRSQK